MPVKPEELRVESYVMIDGNAIPVASLDERQKQVMAAVLKERYLNTLYAGQAVFKVECPYDLSVFDALRKELAVHAENVPQTETKV